MTGRLVRVNGALGASGASQSRVRGSLLAGAEVSGDVPITGAQITVPERSEQTCSGSLDTLQSATGHKHLQL